MDDMDEIVQEFLVESYENLDQLDQDLVALESEPGSRDLLSSIFRTVHTIKGTSGFLGMGALESVSHTGEGLLSELRDGVRVMTPATTDVLLELVDTIRAMLASIEAGESDSAVDSEEVREAITAILEGAPTPPPVEAPQEEAAEIETEGATENQVVEEPAEAAEEPVAPSSAPAPDHRETEEHSIGRPSTESTVRVDVNLLDSLMRQVGELVLVRNQMERLIEQNPNVDLQRAGQNLNLISAELQEEVMKTRMQPIDHVWSKMPRVVRDLSKSLGRGANLVMEGRETEVDRSLIEAVKDPLTHLVRNAIDHGIEAPEERVAAGKAPEGQVTLRAYHADGQVVVEIEDDGKGIDADAVLATAVRRGVVSPEVAPTLTTSEIFDLLFQPGFSTAKKVTNVSGRGVGMDVVRDKIEAIGGTVEVESQLGAGTIWRLHIPLTLAILPALTVECGGEVFAVSQVNLLELVAIEDRADDSHIEHVGNAPVYRLRGSLLPLVSLTEVLELEPTVGSAVIAVIQVDNHRFGLIVDRVINTEEIVVKGLSGRINQIGLYSGATVLGDGNVALILDVQAVARHSLSSDIGELIRAKAGVTQADTAAEGLAQLLVVSIGDGRRVALPLDSVTRLARMPADSVERVGHREVIQYRGALLPLIRLDQLLGAFGNGDEAEMLVVVLRGRHGEQLAVVVSEIVDIVDHDLSAGSGLDDSGLLGSIVVGERVTELLDVDSLITSNAPINMDGSSGAGFDGAGQTGDVELGMVGV